MDRIFDQSVLLCPVDEVGLNNWLVVWNIFYFSVYIYILGIIIPTD